MCELIISSIGERCTYYLLPTTYYLLHEDQGARKMLPRVTMGFQRVTALLQRWTRAKRLAQRFRVSVQLAHEHRVRRVELEAVSQYDNFMQ